MKKRKKVKKIQTWSVALWTALAYVFVAVCVVYSAYQIRTYEDGILEIYANQQDAYVQLVLDQINLNKAEATDEDIRRIIATLESSNNKYWTLSENQTLIFVKDVTETNKYKGFTSNTYYISESAKEFLDSLTTNRVSHKRIEVGEREYITSGVVFVLHNMNYQICLLTNPEAILDQNAYLSARVNLSLMIGIVLFGFLIVIIAMARQVSKAQKELKIKQADNENLSRLVENLNQQLSIEDAYDIRRSLFSMEYFEMFYDKFRDRKIGVVTFMLIRYKNQQDREFFLQDSVLMLEKQILRFKDDEHSAILLASVGMDESQTKSVMDWIVSKKLSIVAVKEVRNSTALEPEQILEELYGQLEK